MIFGKLERTFGKLERVFDSQTELRWTKYNAAADMVHIRRRGGPYPPPWWIKHLYLVHRSSVYESKTRSNLPNVRSNLPNIMFYEN